MNIRNSLFKNGVASLINKGIKIAEQLLLVPFFISAWGAPFYGEWLTLTIIPSIIGFSDLGFGTAAANFFILKFAANQKQDAANISKSGFISIHIIIISTLILSFLFILALNFYGIFDKSLIPKKEAILAVSFLMLSRVLGFYQPLNDAYFKAARKASLAMNLNGFNLGLNLVVGLVVLIFKGGIVLFAFSNLIINVIFTIFYSVNSRRILTLHNEYEGIVLKSDIIAIFEKGFGFLLSPVWQAIYFQGTTFIVRIFLGPVAVTIFNTVRTLTRAVNQANAIVISAVSPDLQFEMGVGNFERARKIFRFSLFIITIITISGSVFLFLRGSWFYEIWTNKSLNPPLLMWNVFIVGIIFNAYWWMSSEVFNVLNQPYKFTIVALIASVISIVLTYFSTVSFGLLGAAIGNLFLDIFLLFYLFPRSCILIKQPLNSLLSNVYFDCKEMFNKTIQLKKI